MPYKARRCLGQESCLRRHVRCCIGEMLSKIDFPSAGCRQRKEDSARRVGFAQGLLKTSVREIGLRSLPIPDHTCFYANEQVGSLLGLLLESNKNTVQHRKPEAYAARPEC